MSQFLANEIFSDEPFIMLEIGGGWPEKFVRFFSSRLLNWDRSRRERASVIETGIFIQGGALEGACCLARNWATRAGQRPGTW